MKGRKPEAFGPAIPSSSSFNEAGPVKGRKREDDGTVWYLPPFGLQ